MKNEIETLKERVNTLEAALECALNPTTPSDLQLAQDTLIASGELVEAIANNWKTRLAALEAENAAMREAARWIPVGEKLPEPDKSVLVLFRYDGDGFPEIPRIGFGIKFLDEHEIHTIDGDFDTTVTHWRPMPPPPEQDEEGEK